LNAEKYCISSSFFPQHADEKRESNAGEHAKRERALPWLDPRWPQSGKVREYKATMADCDIRLSESNQPNDQHR
jgi:hypothetical protein